MTLTCSGCGTPNGVPDSPKRGGYRCAKCKAPLGLAPPFDFLGELALASLSVAASEKQDVKYLAGPLSTVDRALAVRELFGLRMAAVFHAATTLVLEAVQDDLRTAMMGMLHPFILERTNGLKEANEAIDFLNERYKQYVEAYHSPPQGKNPLWVVGNIFAEHCGVAKSIEAILIAAREFPACLMQLAEVYRAFQELPGGEIIVVRRESLSCGNDEE